MYKAFFGLKKNPFRMSPDSEFLFLTLRHREALAGLTYAITERKGFLALTGQAGTGKTTLLTWVLERLSGEQVASSVIFNPVLTQSEFLETVLLGFGIDEMPDSKPRRLRKLEEFLLNADKSGKVSALIVDEAHKLSPELLEEIRLMGNYERYGEKLLQILLIGQSELDDILNRPDLGQLKQRISVRLTIEPLDLSELERYIQHRWTKAGGHEAPFPPQVINRLFHWSGGIPRLVNSLSDNALTLAFAESENVLRIEHIDSVAKDLRLTVPAGRNFGTSLGPVPAKIQVPVPVPSPVSNGKAPGEDSPQVTVRATSMMTLERYVTPPKTASFLARWAGKFGLA